MGLPHTRRSIPARFRNAAAGLSRLYSICARTLRAEELPLAGIAPVAVVTLAVLGVDARESVTTMAGRPEPICVRL